MGITINISQIVSIDYHWNPATKKHFLIVYMSANVRDISGVSYNRYSFGFSSVGKYQAARDWFDKRLNTDIDMKYETPEM